MRGNIPINELPFAEEVWLMVAVISVRERRTQQGKPFRDANARNATGNLLLKIWGEVLEGREDLRPGLWGVTGKLESFQDRAQFVIDPAGTTQQQQAGVRRDRDADFIGDRETVATDEFLFGEECADESFEANP